MFKEYFEYRRKKKNIKRKMVNLMSTMLSAVDMCDDIVNFVIRLTNQSKEYTDEELIEKVMDNLSTTLSTNNERLIEVLSFIVNNPEYIQKIVANAVAQTKKS